MKKLIAACIITGCFGLFTMAAHAQDTTSAGQDIKNAAKETGKAVSKGTKAVANKTAELASKGNSAVVDKVYKGKTGPGGQIIYINDKSQYYWVDSKGHRNFVKESELKDKKG
jgi:hypothetical protein